MRYSDFIGQLADLAAEGDGLCETSSGHTDPAFRRWRNAVQSLVEEATALGYRLPGAFKSSLRAYMPMYPTANPQDILTAFRRDLSDTLNEIRHLIDQHQRYGEPKSIQIVSGERGEPTAPEKVTLHWLFKHVPISLWGAASGALAIAFILGAAVGNTGLVKAFLGWFKSIWP